jgi:hypothetical protein
MVVAIAAAAGLAATGVLRGTYAAGGSDSSCYALMADAFASGALQPRSALESQVPWPEASNTFAPGGFVSSRQDPAAAAPVCAPGFSLLLAPAMKLGGRDALFVVTPIVGALLVWLAFAAARALSGPVAGVMAAVLVATSPIVLFQVVQPMNDITTAMLWMAVFVALISGRSALAGVCCGLALLVRPNLLPLAVIAAAFAVVQKKVAEKAEKGAGVISLKNDSGTFFLAALPFVLVALWLNLRLYGSPFQSGYGRLGNLFSVGNIAGNAARYSRWLVQTQTIWIVAGFAAPFLVTKDRRAAAWLAVALVITTAGIYFAYTPFEDWSYLRFLLPAIALLIVLMSSVTVRITERVAPRAVPIIVAAAATLALGYHSVVTARDRLAFQMQALEQRYRSAGLVARDVLPADAAILTTWDSGAIRFHAQKEAIVWDALDPAWLDRAIQWLSVHGHRPFILVESWEEPRFRARFSESSPLGKLDWPPKYEVDRTVRIYDPVDRERFLRGERVTTAYLWPLLKR